MQRMDVTSRLKTFWLMSVQ